MSAQMRYRLRSGDGRYAGYASGPRTASLGDETTAYVFRMLADAQAAAAKFSHVLGVAIDVEEHPFVPGRLRAGDIVRFTDPQTPHESKERYEILEHRGDRVLVRALDSDMRIEPTSVLQVADLEVA